MWTATAEAIIHRRHFNPFCGGYAFCMLFLQIQIEQSDADDHAQSLVKESIGGSVLATPPGLLFVLLALLVCLVLLVLVVC
jgi:hypothetical protein